MKKTKSATALHSLPEAARLLGCGKYTIMTLHEAGDLEIVKLGRLTRVTDRSLRALLRRLPKKPGRARRPPGKDGDTPKA